MAINLDLMKDKQEVARLKELRQENAEFEFLKLRLAELPPGYNFKNERLTGPEGSLLPARLADAIADKIHQNPQVFGRLVQYIGQVIGAFDQFMVTRNAGK